MVLAAGMLVGGSALLRERPQYLLRAGFLAFIPAMVPLVLLGLQRRSTRH